MMTVGRGRITQVDDTDVVQRIQIDRGPQDLAVRDKTPLVGLFGLSSNPPLKSHAIVLSVGGDWHDAVAIATNDQVSRPKNLSPGDVVIYDAHGQTLLLNAAGVTLTDKFGQTIVASSSGVEITDHWGNTLNMAQSAMTLTHSAKIVLSAPEVDLGGTGGQPVARKGDAVSSSAITAGSSTVKAT
jgi:phage baseplate assembly protein V